MAYKIDMEGKPFRFENLPKEAQDRILDKFTKGVPALRDVIETGKIGIKIDGIEVGYDNIQQFEKEDSAPVVPKYDEEGLFALNKRDQIALLSKLGYTGKPILLEKNRVKKILELQGDI
jgi:hypothetical protein